jgi:hypothetical protein
LRADLVADRVHQVRLAEADAAVDEQRVVGAPGFSATCTAAARASWLLLPSTKLANVKSGVQAPAELRQGSPGAGRGARLGLVAADAAMPGRRARLHR